MTLFKNQTAQDIWIEHNCHRCFQPDEAARREHGKDTQCPIQEQALRTGRKPTQWERKPRAQTMAGAIKCNAYQAKPSLNRRGSAQPYDESMFGDDSPYRVDVGFVPVDGWPDRPKKDKGVDHQ